MNRDFLYLYNMIKDSWCAECDINECNGCQVKTMKELVQQLDNYYGDAPAESNEGCHICKDKKGKNKEVFYDSGRGGFPVAKYCPECGRKM